MIGTDGNPPATGRDRWHRFGLIGLSLLWPLHGCAALPCHPWLNPPARLSALMTADLGAHCTLTF